MTRQRPWAPGRTGRRVHLYGFIYWAVLSCLAIAGLTGGAAAQTATRCPTATPTTPSSLAPTASPAAPVDGCRPYCGDIFLWGDNATVLETDYHRNVVHVTGSVTLWSNDEVTAMGNAFPRLEEIGEYLTVMSNDFLTSLDTAFPKLVKLGFSDLTRNSGGNSLTILNNHRLVTFGTAFAALRRIRGTLQISENPQLTDWDGLRNLSCHGGFINGPSTSCPNCPDWLLGLPTCNELDDCTDPPTPVPTTSPTTSVPTTSVPTTSPTMSPTTVSPTASPTTLPTISNPTTSPTTSWPTAGPTSSMPTGSPTTSPTIDHCSARQYVERGIAVEASFCRDLTECNGTSYEAVAPTRSSDRRCASTTACSPGVTYQASPPTATSDRVCARARACTSFQYAHERPTLTTDTICEPCTQLMESECPAGQIVANCTRTADAFCADPPQDQEATNNAAAADTDDGTTTATVIAVVVAVVVVAAILAVARHHWVGQRTSNPTTAYAMTANEAFGASDKQWDFFISHTQRSGHATTIASELHADLEAAGYRCWLDVKMEDRSEAGMKEGVVNCKVVIAVITGACVNPDRPEDDPKTNAFFSRKFCVQELGWADEAEIPIQPVIRSADKHRIGDFLAEAPANLKHLGNTDFITLDRSDRDYWRTGIAKIIRAGAKALSGAGPLSTDHPFSAESNPSRTSSNGSSASEPRRTVSNTSNKSRSSRLSWWRGKNVDETDIDSAAMSAVILAHDGDSAC